MFKSGLSSLESGLGAICKVQRDKTQLQYQWMKYNRFQNALEYTS